MRQKGTMPASIKAPKNDVVKENCTMVLMAMLLEFCQPSKEISSEIEKALGQ